MMTKIVSLRAASIAGIIYLTSFIASGVFYFLGNILSQGGSIMFHLFVAASSILVAAHFCFLWGYARLGGLVKKKFLAVAACILMASDVLTAMFFLLLAIVPQATLEHLVGIESTGAMFSLVRIALTAAMNLLFGIALFSLRHEFGKIAVAAGVLSIIMSVCMGSIMAAPLALVMMVPTVIVEIILLCRAAKKYQV